MVVVIDKVMWPALGSVSQLGAGFLDPVVATGGKRPAFIGSRLEITWNYCDLGTGEN
jgi:hypothetical protein